MHEDSADSGLRDLALQKIGRNVLNYQRLEAMLRHLLVMCDVSARPRDLGSAIANRTSKVAKLPMGHLVELGAKQLFVEEEVSEGSSTEASMRFSFTLEGGESAAKHWRRALLEVVKERNKLVHRTLAGFNPHSAESCRAIIATLDAQRERLLQPYEHISSLVAAMQTGYGEAVDALERELAGATGGVPSKAK